MERMYEEHHPDSLVLECVWQARATKDERYLVPAVEHWDLWFTRAPGGQLRAGLAGPALGHGWVRSTIGEHSWGIQLKAHVVLPGVSKRILLGGEQYADILAVRESAGLPIATGDAQTAAICRSRDAVCATRNTKDFIHTGAALINPWTGEEQPSTVEVLRDLGGVLAQPADAL